MKLTHKAQAVLQYVMPATAAYTLFATYILSGESLDGRAIVAKAGGIAVVALAATLAQDLVPKPAKEVVVFYRFNHRLPGHRAFSGSFADDARFNLQKITNINKLSELGPAEQQRTFYKIYLKHANYPQVSHYSFRYIAWRDTAATYALLSIITIPVAVSVGGLLFLIPALKVFVGTVFAYLATASAARSMGNELVRQVLSKETMGRSHGITQ